MCVQSRELEMGSSFVVASWNLERGPKQKSRPMNQETLGTSGLSPFGVLLQGGSSQENGTQNKGLFRCKSFFFEIHA